MAEAAGERAAHTRPDGSKFYTAYGEKYRCGSWEAASGQVDAHMETIINDWKKSTRHNAILLNKSITNGAVGIYEDSDNNTIYLIFVAIK